MLRLPFVRSGLALMIAGAAAANRAVAQPGGSASSVETERAAAADTALRIIVSVTQRRLAVVTGSADTLLYARVAVGSARSMSYGGHRWMFTTPRGVRAVLTKEQDPVWLPPDWHYIEVARREHLRIVWLHRDTSIALGDGASLIMKDMTVRIEDDSTYEKFGGDDEIIVDNTLYVPPIGSPNRRVPGELGKYRLVLGDAVGIHGTPDTGSVGHAATHGCMRLYDADILWLYEHIPVGTRVYIY
jgi:lipoprotein-anchoring transpeptidase ErfK/SrfK